MKMLSKYPELQFIKDTGKVGRGHSSSEGGGGVVVGLHIDKYISYIYASVDLSFSQSR